MPVVESSWRCLSRARSGTVQSTSSAPSRAFSSVTSAAGAHFAAQLTQTRAQHSSQSAQPHGGSSATNAILYSIVRGYRSYALSIRLPDALPLPLWTGQLHHCTEYRSTMHSHRAGTYSTSPASAANQDARLTAPDILLRYQDSNTTQSNRIALDIGGTLTKVAFIASDTLEPGFFEEPHTAAAAYPESAPAQQQQYIYKAHSAVNTAVNKSGGVAHGARLQFKLFDTACVDEVVEFIAKFAVRGGNLGLATAAAEGVAPVQVIATGGGALKYAQLFRDKLGIELQARDEVECLVQGANFLMRSVLNESFEVRGGERAYLQPPDLTPVQSYMLANIGTGVSFIKVDASGTFERVGGSHLGGGAFWGLCRLLTGAKTYEEMLRLTDQGDSSKIDMLVGDIYGGSDYEAVGLSADTIASSFGKIATQPQELEDYNPADLALALRRMVAYNIGHCATLTAQQHGLPRIYFSGNFVRAHPYTTQIIAWTVGYWSNRKIQACFLQHEGFLGTVGAFLDGYDVNVQGSHCEHAAAATDVSARLPQAA